MATATKDRDTVATQLGEAMEAIAGQVDRISSALADAAPEARAQALVWLTDFIEDLEVIGDELEDNRDSTPRRRLR